MFKMREFRLPFPYVCKKEKRVYHIDEELCVKEHYTLQSDTNYKQPCVDQSRVTKVIMTYFPQMISYAEITDSESCLFGDYEIK